MEVPELPHPYQYFSNGAGKNYLLLPLPSGGFRELPETVTVFKTLLTKRPEFHVTIGCITDIVSRTSKIPTLKLENMLLSLFVEQVQKTPIRLVSYSNDFRYATSNERRSLVVRCEVSNMEKLYQLWEKELEAPISRQPTHVTIYTLAPYPGISISSYEEMEQLPKVRESEVEEALHLS